MAKKSVNSTESIDTQQLKSLHRIEDILSKDAKVQVAQVESLRRIETFAEMDRVIQSAQVYEEHKIKEDEDKSLKISKDILDSIKKLGDAITKSIGSESRKISYFPESQKLGGATPLVPTVESVAQDKQAEKLKLKDRPFSVKKMDFLDRTGIVKRGSTGFFARMYGVPEAEKLEEKQKYIRREREYGSKESEEKLSKQFEELQSFLRSKETTLKEIKGTKEELNLTDTQFSETQSGKSLLAKLEMLDESISKLDSSFKKEVEQTEQVPEVAPVADMPEWEQKLNELDKIAKEFKSGTTSDTKHEHEIELEKANEEQTELLKQIEENTRVKDIPEKEKKEKESEKEKPKAEEKSIPESIIDSLADSTILKKTKKVTTGAKGFLKSTGKLLGKAIPLAATAVGAYNTIDKLQEGDYAGAAEEGAVTAASMVPGAGTIGMVAHEGAKAFAGSFGEGGFELIQQLRKQDAISYGFGTTPTVDNWDIIEKLPQDKIQTLIATNEFEGEDLKHLQSLIQPVQAIPSVEPVAKSGTDYIIKPNVDKGSQIYNQSAENAEQAINSSTNNNTVIAPTTVNNSTVTKQDIKLPVRNDDDTTRRFVSSRYTN